MKHWSITFVFTLITALTWAQEKATVSGHVVDEYRYSLDHASVVLKNTNIHTFTDTNGYFEIDVPAGEGNILVFSYTESTKEVKIPVLNPGQKIYRNVRINTGTYLDPVVAKGQRNRPRPVITLDPKELWDIPTQTFEQIIIGTALGVRSSNELSASYSVRGGNFDENLVYVNDIEVYRPFLVRSGQQEGLSFVNVDMVENVVFSSGGFQSKYGDKLSSVMDITYKEPKKFSSTVEASMLGGSIEVEDRSSLRFSYVIGARYRSNQYVLNGLDVQGNYKPRFFDLQSFLTYNFTSHLSVNLLTNYSQNRFLLVPESQETSFGTVQNALRLYVQFGGQELMSYETFMNGLSFVYRPDRKNEYKLISSVYSTTETEHFTVEGAYRLDLLENNLGSDDFGESKTTLGVGYFINHARNDLNAIVYSEKLMGRHRNEKSRSVIEWGIKFQGELIDDRLREWDYNDSSGHNISIPGYNDSVLRVANFLRTDIGINSYRVMGYVQESRILNERSNLRINYGIRSNYWTLNNQNVISPRVQLSWEPNKKFNDALKDSVFDIKSQKALLKNNWLVRSSFGYYFQPPFYRELRNNQGLINESLKAQRSIHFVMGGDLDFLAWDRPFKFVVEGYYKKFDQLIPYYVDDVRIRYSALNTSEGYATGIDARVNGEFIKGLESYVNMSFLTTKENISYLDAEGKNKESGFIRRPTDQRFNASILFQDELRSDSTFRLQLQLVFGTNLPYYFDGERRYIESLKIPAYRRVDIGFSKVLFDRKTSRRAEKFSYLERLWISVEVFNMLQFNNTISYIWVKDINNNVYGVPNRLTGRRLNLRIRAEF